MLHEASGVCSDISVLRRLSFAAYSLHRDTPKYWELVTKFSFAKCSGCAIPSIDKVKLLVENVKYLDEDAFNTDSDLRRELMKEEGFQGKSLGIVLISANSKCKLCGGDLLVRADRPSFPIIYSDDIGTANGTHFRKYCQNNWKGCSFTQSYGFYTNGNDSEVIYDDNYHQLPYFLSSHMTAFQTKVLSNLTAEMLLGQISYRQRADIYNYIHGYDQTKKQSVAAVPSEFGENGDYDRYMYVKLMSSLDPRVSLYHFSHFLVHGLTL
jgi:hypothetical protein